MAAKDRELRQKRHITLDRAMWGSDQAASVEPHGIARLVRDVRAVELTGLVASIVHLAYHLGAMWQIARETRGPREGTFPAP